MRASVILLSVILSAVLMSACARPKGETPQQTAMRKANELVAFDNPLLAHSLSRSLGTAPSTTLTSVASDGDK